MMCREREIYRPVSWKSVTTEDVIERRELVAEIYLPIERLVAYYGRNLDGVHFPYNFALLTANWSASIIAE
jgi:alpha-glucosidase